MPLKPYIQEVKRFQAIQFTGTKRSANEVGWAILQNASIPSGSITYTPAKLKWIVRSGHFSSIDYPATVNVVGLDVPDILMMKGDFVVFDNLGSPLFKKPYAILPEQEFLAEFRESEIGNE